MKGTTEPMPYKYIFFIGKSTSKQTPRGYYMYYALHMCLYSYLPTHYVYCALPLAQY